MPSFGPSHIMLPGRDGGGYSYGVEAKGKGWEWAELHGGFKTYAEARNHVHKLLAEYEDYEYAYVVKIETPRVPVGKGKGLVREEIV